LEIGAVHDTVALALPEVATTSVGAWASVEGVTDDDATDGKPSPEVLWATTEKV